MFFNIIILDLVPVSLYYFNNLNIVYHSIHVTILYECESHY